jgi:cyclic dehypoxanthinyl futalosine synthase
MSISKSQALDMLRSDDLLGIGMEADAVRKRLHPGNVVTYQIDRNVNYTNICTEYCSFCAFYRPVGSPIRCYRKLKRPLPWAARAC